MIFTSIITKIFISLSNIISVRSNSLLKIIKAFGILQILICLILHEKIQIQNGSTTTTIKSLIPATDVSKLLKRPNF
ncbi:unnamed protein product [Rhizophagus irregularis]|nr:unnamed protein product [Rhizophagus irregularis]CAB5359706.1 unnamed protein product [Rhizophagus irregularis]